MSYHYDPTCPCEHCEHINFKRYINSLENRGGTWHWKDTGRTRDRQFLWWKWKEKEQTKIGIPDMAYDYGIMKQWIRIKDDERTKIETD